MSDFIQKTAIRKSKIIESEIALHTTKSVSSTVSVDDSEEKLTVVPCELVASIVISTGTLDKSGAVVTTTVTSKEI